MEDLKFFGCIWIKNFVRKNEMEMKMLDDLIIWDQ